MNELDSLINDLEFDLLCIGMEIDFAREEIEHQQYLADLERFAERNRKQLAL